MIFPFLDGVKSFYLAPLTWIIIALNTLIFFMIAPEQMKTEASISRKLADSEVLITQGHIYLQYLKIENKKLIGLQKIIRHQAEQGERRALELLSFMAIRDYDFLQVGDKYQYSGDQVAIARWLREFQEFREINEKRPVTVYGLAAGSSSWRNWITYQFVHAGALHLLSNMIVFLLFAAALEVRIGSGWVVATYIGGGIAGAQAFLSMTGFTTAPVIGASGAVSALIAFYAALEVRPRVRFFYFFGPFKDYFGFVHLPTWLIFPICFFADLASIIIQPAEMGGIAYAAHIGGMAFGFGMAMAVRLLESTGYTDFRQRMWQNDQSIKH